MGKVATWLIATAAALALSLFALMAGFGAGFAAGVNAAPIGVASSLVDKLKFEVPRCEAGSPGPLTGLKRLIPNVSFLNDKQRANAQIIYDVGTAMGMSDPDIATGWATSMQESGLINVAYGDRDSLGLFQQRPSQGWGTAEQIMDPAYSTRKFFEGLKKVAGRESMSMMDRAIAVQRPRVSAYLQTWKWDDRVKQMMDGLIMPAPQASPSAASTKAPGTLLNCLGLSTAPSSATVCERGTDAGSATTFQGTSLKLCRVEGVTVNASVARQYADMVADARSKGVTLKGSGFRSYQSQQALYVKHGCKLVGSRSQCSNGPPTATPGSSQHEAALAIDFDFGSNKSSAGYQYLQGNAERFGFKNFPKEAWHWSTTGR